MRPRGLFTLVLWALGALLILFLTVPVVLMVSSETPATLWGTFAERNVRSALWTSVSAAAISTGMALLVGVPLGYLLARREFAGKALVAGLVDMPVVIPRTVAGIALLTVLAPGGVLGSAAAGLGVDFADALPGTVAAMLFVSAPFTVNAARSGFEAVPVRLEQASRGLGASPAKTFFRVSLPLAAGAIVSGAVMSWARAVSEFGAVLMIAYYPMTGPTLIYERFTSFGLKAARPVAVLLVLVSLGMFVLLRLRGGRGRRAAGEAPGA